MHASADQASTICEAVIKFQAGALQPTSPQYEAGSIEASQVKALQGLTRDASSRGHVDSAHFLSWGRFCLQGPQGGVDAFVRGVV